VGSLNQLASGIQVRHLERKLELFCRLPDFDWYIALLLNCSGIDYINLSPEDKGVQNVYSVREAGQLIGRIARLSEKY
jgi:hypothetical protein